jgi:hypothetical protein
VSGSKPTRHLVGVWNPAYADAMDATIELLLSHALAFGSRDGGSEEDVYIWWGKVKSSNRQKPLPHLAEILALDEELNREDGAAQEVHLYLTDYQSLYVAHVGEITADDVRGEDDDHVPAFYRDEKLNCDCWFRLFDIRRVVTDDTLGVVQELKKLSNTRYNDRPVSIYGGMVELPLIVTRKDGARYFEPDVREALTGGKFWVEFDAERTGIGQMEQELRENLIGEAAWANLDPAARSFVATAESVFRTHRNDAAFDFAPVIVDLAKAFEVQTNLMLRRGLAEVLRAERMANIDGRSVDLAAGQLLSLGQLAHVIAEEHGINRALKKRLTNGEWFTSSLPPILRELSELRNPAAHAARVGRAEIATIRNRTMGVGCQGTLVELAKTR